MATIGAPRRVHSPGLGGASGGASPARESDASPAEPRWSEPLAWTRLAIGMVAAGYAIVAVDWLLRAGAGDVTEVLAAAVASVAFLASRRRPLLATGLTLAAVWLEVTVSMFTTSTPRSLSVLVYPALATTGGLLLGGRAALAVALGGVAAIVVDATVDGTWGPTPLGDHGHWVLAACLITMGSAAMAAAVRRSYGAVLARSEDARRRYAELFADVPDGLVALGADGRVAEVNPAAARLLREEPDALRGVSVLDALRRVGAPAGVELAAAARPGSPLPLSLARDGAPPRALEISARVSPEGGPSLLVLRDVTQRRDVEERLGHAQRLESLGHLAGGVAHDFNSLLTAVAGNASLLAGSATAEVREVASEIEEACRRGTALTRQLLAFARRDAHRPEPLDLAEVVAGTSRLLERVLGPRHLLALETRSAPVRADRAQLEQVALNLVANARDAMPGGGTVSVSVRPVDEAAAHALGSALAAPRQAVLEVADTGVGMAPEVLAHIFEPFFTTKPRGQGTGLGLATVHGIAAQSGGHLSVDSAPGRGTRIRLFLPAREAREEGAAP